MRDAGILTGRGPRSLCRMIDETLIERSDVSNVIKLLSRFRAQIPFI